MIHAQRQSTPGDHALVGWRLAAFYAALAVLVTAPVLAIQVPLLGDMPNHLARIHILESLGTASPLSGFYMRQTGLVPYQAMDVVVRLLRVALPLYEAGRVFLVLCLLMPPAAAAALRCAIHRRVGLLPAFAFLFSYNYLLARGLLDYLFAAGLALLLFALWLRLAGWSTLARACVCAIGLAFVFLGHAYAGVVYCILVAGDRIAAAMGVRFRPWRSVALDWLAAAAQALPCLVLAFGFGASGKFGGPVVTRYGSVAAKIGAALTPVHFPAPPAVVAVFGLVPIVAIVVAATLRARFAPALRGPAIAVAIAAAIAPNVLFNAWATDMRLPLVLAVLLAAGLVPRFALGTRSLQAAACVLLALVTLRAAFAMNMLAPLDRQAAQLRGLLLALPPGARLLVVDDAADNAPLRVVPPEYTGHAALLATIDRDAFVPFLLSGATPILPRPGFAAMSSPNNGPINMRQLRDGATRQDTPGGAPPSYGFGANMYWLGWKQKFDHVLVMQYGAPAGAVPPGLREAARVPLATLFAVKQEGGAALRP